MKFLKLKKIEFIFLKSLLKVRLKRKKKLIMTRKKNDDDFLIHASHIVNIEYQIRIFKKKKYRSIVWATY